MADLEMLRKTIDDIDGQMAELFEKRMKTSEQIARFKRENGVAVRDEKREEALIERNSAFIAVDAIRPYYAQFIRETIELSCAYQRELMGDM